MCADSGNAVAEGSHKDNNCAAALVPLIVTQSQLPDLAVTDILVPMEARAGQTVTLTWVVSNLGEVATPISAWSDYVYLSRDRVMDTTDSRLGWARHDGVLAVGESYTNSLDVTIPKTVAGPCYFYVHTDQNDAVVELDEENNCLLSQSAVSISLPPQADLQIIGIFPPATATPGVSNTFTWVITNAGPNTAEGTWVDSVYLSPDPVWDASDAVVGRISHQGPLAPGETYTASLTTPVPGLTPGDYYVIVRTDLRNSVRETSEMNNIAVAESATFVDVLELTLGQAFTNQLTLGAENYYKVQVRSNETMRVTLDGAAGYGFNELFARYGWMPSLGDYDFLYDHPLEPDQQIIVPQTQEGWYYVMARGEQVPTPPAEYSVKAEVLQFGITSVSPSQIGDNGQVTITVKGAKFDSGCTVELVSSTNRLMPGKLIWLDSATLKARFFLTNAPRSRYDVILRNPDGVAAIAVVGVVVEEATKMSVSVAMTGDQHPRIGRKCQVPFIVRNTGNIDAQYVTVLARCTIPVQIGWLRPETTLPHQTDPGFDAQGNSPTTEFTGGGTIDGFIVRDLEPAQTVSGSAIVSGFSARRYGFALHALPETTTAFVVRLNEFLLAVRQNVLDGGWPEMPASAIPVVADQGSWLATMLQMFAADGYCEADVTNSINQYVSQSVSASTRIKSVDCGDAGDCYNHSDWKAVKAKCVTDRSTGCWKVGGICGTVGGLLAKVGGANIGIAFAATIVVGTVCYAPCFNYSTKACFTEYNTKVTACLADILDCERAQVSITCSSETPQMQAQRRQKQEGGSSSSSGGGSAGSCFTPVSPMDPNEMTGPSGFGSDQFIAVQRDHLYTIYFENIPTATAYAQRIMITNNLDTSLDPRSIQLKEVAFGSETITIPDGRSFYQKRIALGTNFSNILADLSAGLDIENRQIRWTLTAIDPKTGEQPESANLGLLPPNTTNHIGEGHVSYTIRAMPGTPTGIIVSNMAAIVFDVNEPIATPSVWNTIDGGIPSSTVLPLPALGTSSTFPLMWMGEDDATGSGLAGIDVYVSDNGATSVPWLTGTTDTSAIFTGQNGHTYAFYSVARDNAGNAEAPPSVPDATTTLSFNSPPTLSAIDNYTVVVNAQLTITNTASDPDGAAQTLTYTLDPGAPAGATINAATGLFRWRPDAGQASTTNLITVRVTDNGTPNLSAAQSFTVVVAEYVEPALGSGLAQTGDNLCLPIRLLSSVGLTNLSFRVNYDPARLTNLVVHSLLPSACSASLTSVDPSNALIRLTVLGPQPFRGTQQLAEVCFTLCPGQQSAFLPMRITATQARQTDGSTVVNLVNTPGRLTVIGEEPLLELVINTNGHPTLVLYGKPAWTCDINESPRLDAAPPWPLYRQTTLDDVFQTFDVTPATNAMRFFRAVRK